MSEKRKANPEHKLINCKGCGRDTRSINGYCIRCAGHTCIGGHELTQIDDRKDRHILTIDGDPTFWQTEPNKDDYN